MIFEKKSKNFKSLIFLFFLLTFFISLFLNFHSYEDKLENSIFFQMELSNNLDSEQQSELEKKILQFKNVKKVRYYSKDEGIKNLERELNISLPSGTNSLPNILVTYVEDRESAEKIMNELEDESRIADFYLDAEMLDRTILHRKIFKLLKILTAVFFLLPSSGAILSLYYGMREHNLIFFYLTSRERNTLQQRAKRVSMFPMLFSAILGVLIYLNLYSFLQIKLADFGSDFIKASSELLGILALGSAFILLLIAQLTPFSKKYRGAADE